jgi:hypothetical protein
VRKWFGSIVALVAIGLALSATGGATVASPSKASGPPPVPGVGKGVYLGAFVNPKGGQPNPPCGQPGYKAGSNEFPYVPSFERRVGRGMAILHLYTCWGQLPPVAALRTISHHFGAVPLLDWSCGDSDANVAAGLDDRLIYDWARALRSYGKPVFLRWFWEMNLADRAHAGCLSAVLGSPGEDYVAAWQHIWKIFHGQLSVAGSTVDATNVAFVWCPSLDNSTYPSYFPNASTPTGPVTDYVDWVCADEYSHGNPGPRFASLFQPFYDWVEGRRGTSGRDRGVPVMIGETGSGNTASGEAKGDIQAPYLRSALTAIRGRHATMRAVRAFVYFDAIGTKSDWDLEGEGFGAFRLLGRHFTFGEPPRARPG